MPYCHFLVLWELVWASFIPPPSHVWEWRSGHFCGFILWILFYVLFLQTTHWKPINDAKIWIRMIRIMREVSALVSYGIVKWIEGYLLGGHQINYLLCMFKYHRLPVKSSLVYMLRYTEFLFFSNDTSLLWQWLPLELIYVQGCCGSFCVTRSTPLNGFLLLSLSPCLISLCFYFLL